MRVRTLIRLSVIALAMGLAALATPAQEQSSDDVAAAARKAREQQKNTPKAKKVLTNDDIPSTNTNATEATEKKPEGQEGLSQAGKDNAENDPKSEASELIRSKHGFQFHKDLGYDPSVYYLSP